MRTLYDLPAPAKLNLFLHITGRRADGYHLLQSVFLLLDWCDTLHIEARPHHSALSREDIQATDTPLPSEDLTVRAARALQAATGCRQGAHISLDKRLPTQAGLGGGSSDAATTLLALNRLWSLGLSRSELQRIGLKLGAEVPFFLGGHNAWVEGIGERLTPLSPAQQPPRTQWLVVKPTSGLDTPTIFSHPSLERNFKSATISDFAAQHYDFGQNALQPVAQLLCPEISQVLTWLQSQGLQGRMTGSGSAVFAAMPHTVNLLSASSKWQTKVCNNLELHPLAGWASD